MDYRDSGFDQFLKRKTSFAGVEPSEQTGDDTSHNIKRLSGTSISSGVSKSSDNKLEINWDKASFITTDGARNRVEIGKIPGTKSYGIRICDVNGNEVFSASGQIQTSGIADSAVTNVKVDNLSADKITTGTLTLGDTGVNLIAESGELTLNSGADLVLTGDNGGGAKTKFIRSDNVEFAKIVLAETWTGETPTASELDIDPSADNTMELWFGSSYNWKSISFNTTGPVNFNTSSFTINNGTPKTAIVPTKDGYRALYTNESPELWFMDFGKIVRKWWKFWKRPTIIVDPLFLEVTSSPYHIVYTLNRKIVQVWGKRKGFEEKRFERKTKKEFEKNEKFLSQTR